MKTLNIILGLVLLALLAWFLVAHQQLIRANVTARDSIAYWAAARLLLHRQDPYSAPTVLALERSEGYQADKPLVLRTPPWSLWMILPLGVLNPYWAWAVWLAVLLASLVLSMRISWRMYGDGIRPPTVFLLAGYLFAPVPGLSGRGSIGDGAAAGRSSLFLPGGAPSMACRSSPADPFRETSFVRIAVADFGDMDCNPEEMVAGRRFRSRILVGGRHRLGVRPGCFLALSRDAPPRFIQHEFIPAFSGVLRLIFFRRFFWAQFLPMAAGFVWSGWYYRKNRRAWSWKEHGAALLVVSVLTTPYAWITDEAILLPAILQGVLWVYWAKANLTLRSQLAIFVFACLDGLLLLILKAKIPFATGIYFWSSLVWVSWYGYAQRFRRVSPADGHPSPVNKVVGRAQSQKF